MLYPAKKSFRIQRKIKSFPGKKTKGVHHHQTIIIRNVKGTYLRKRRKSKLCTIRWAKIYLSTIESEKKTTKQVRTGNHRYGECLDGWQMKERCGGMGEEVRGLRSTNRQLQNIHCNVHHSIGNGVAKELIYMTHGHE